MIHVGFLLHFYQPPSQNREVLLRINEECYVPVFKLLEKLSSQVTVNMNFSLTRQLGTHAPETLGIVSSLSSVEFTSSGAYHPIMPLIPHVEVLRQLKLNDTGNAGMLGSVYSPSGVFPPEMALDDRTARLIASAGYRWTIADDVPWAHARGEVPCKWIPSSEGVAVFLRSNYWSNKIAFHGDNGSVFARDIHESIRQWAGSDNAYLIIAMDGETFGHHRRGTVQNFLAPFLEELTGNDQIRLSSFETILDSFPVRNTGIPSGSWSTTSEDLNQNEPYPLWNHSGNLNHELYWELLRFVLQHSRKQCPEGVAESVDKMLYSCPLWWASPGRESYSQVRRGILTIIEAALDCIPRGKLLDEVMELAGRIPAMAGRDK